MMKDPRNLAFLVVDLKTGKVTVRGNRTEPSAEALRAVSRGAYALPPLLPPVTLGDELLADGGLLHNAPLNAAVKLGATEIVYLCNVHAIPRAGFMRPSTVRSSWRYAEIFFRRASNVGFVDAEIVDDRFRGVPFLAIAPPATLGFGSLVRWMLPRIDAARFLVDTGYAAAKKALEQWDARSVPESVVQGQPSVSA
jgi:predicted acylesterase/phospholipase RssA